MLTTYFGTAPEDSEVATLVRKTLATMKAQGAEVIEVAVPGMAELQRESSVINDEFKFDLADYLARHPGAPVKSLDEGFRLRDAPAVKESEHYRQAMIKRQALRAAVLATFAEHRLDALAYPTLRRKPTLIGEAQTGTNCQLSATTGLPAISFPAGFTDDGLPIAIELLGGAFEEFRLLTLAFAWEQTAKPRRPPFSTPVLVAGTAPRPSVFDLVLRAASGAGPANAPSAQVRFTFDSLTGELGFEARLEVLGADRVIALTLQRSDGEKPGPIVAHLLTAGQSSAVGRVTLRGRDRENLVAGRLFLHGCTQGRPLGIGRTQVKVP